MSASQDSLHSPLTQIICTSVSKTGSSEKKKVYAQEQQKKQATAFNHEGRFITKKISDVGIPQEKPLNYLNSSNKTQTQNDNTLKKPTSTSSNSQSTTVKRHYSSQKLINNNPSRIEKSEISHPISGKQLSTQFLTKQSSIPIPKTKQLSSIKKSQLKSNPAAYQKNEIIQSQAATSQQSSQIMKSLNISQRPLSALATKILTAINIKLLHQSKQNSKFQGDNTLLEQEKSQQPISSKQQQQCREVLKENNQISEILSQSQKSLTAQSKNQQTQHFIEGNSSLNKATFINQPQQYLPTKIQYNQSPKDYHESTNAILCIQSDLHTSKFFVILNETIIEQIIRFLPLKDIAKFANLSRKARKLVPGILSKIDYQKNIDETTLKIQKQSNFGIVNDFIENQQKIVTLLKMHHDEIKQLIEKISPDNDQILGILKAGVLIHLNLTETNINVVDYIKKVGIMQVFQYLTYDYVSLIKLKIDVPPLPSSNMDNNLLYFARFFVKYLTHYINCRLPVTTQRKYYREIQLREVRKLFMQQKENALLKYSQLITRFRSSSNINDYLNKNILSVIITFLNLKDISHLSMSSKMMKAHVKESILQLLPNVERQQSEGFEKAGISKENASTMVYLMHFEWFHAKYHEIFMKKKLNKVVLKALLLALGIIFQNKGGQNIIYSKYGLEIYELNHQIKLASPKKMCQIIEFFDEFPTLKIFKNVIIEKGSNQDITHGVYLYQYIRGLQMAYKLALFGGSLDMKAYNKVLFENDCKLYCYKKLIGIEQDDLLVLESPLTVPQQQIFKERTGFYLFFD